MTPWEIKATELVTCNRSYGLPAPVQRLADVRPPRGRSALFRIKEGHDGDVKLDGLHNGRRVSTGPGPSTRGGASCQPFIDETRRRQATRGAA